MKKTSEMNAETDVLSNVTIGSVGQPGKLAVISTYRDSQNQPRGFGSLYYDGATGALLLGDLQAGLPGSIVIGQAGTNSQSILLNGKNANVTIGGAHCDDGDIIIKTRKGQDAIVLDGKDARLTLGGNDTSGDITIKNATGNPTVTFNGGTSEITVGNTGANGDIFVKNEKGENTILLDGKNGNITLGGGDADGDLTIKNMSGNPTIILSGDAGDITVGGIGANGEIIVKNSNDIETIRIKGSSGDIEFLNADFAEEFDICEDMMALAKPGTVMILDNNSKLTPCQSEYDAKVVGIIAGAGTYKPGIVMDKKEHKNRLPVAMMGKVYCLADADVFPIQVGDMLTTSNKPGHAMKVSDKSKAFGTVIGKALKSLSTGTGLIPVLVNLQ